MNDLEHPSIALLFEDGRIKYWNDNALKWLAHETAQMLLSNSWKQYYYALKNKKKFKFEGKSIYTNGSLNTIWYDSGIGVALGISLQDGEIYVDG